jgi:hypothetical protein
MRSLIHKFVPSDGKSKITAPLFGVCRVFILEVTGRAPYEAKPDVRQKDGLPDSPLPPVVPVTVD